MASFHQIDAKTWRIRVYVSAGDGSEKRVRRSKNYCPIATTPGRLRNELLRAADEFLLEIEEENEKKFSGLTFSDVHDLWRDRYVPGHISGHTAEKYEAILCGHWSDLMAVPVKKIDARLLQSRLDLLGKTLSPSSVIDVFKPVRSILTFAFRLGYIAESPLPRVQMPSKSREEPLKFWTPEQLKLFLHMLDGELYVYRNGVPVPYRVPLFWQAFFFLAVYSGARRQELVALTWGDIDTAAHTISITKAATLYDGKQHTVQPKTAAGRRVIALPGGVFDLLEAHKSELHDRRFSVAKSSPVFPQENGRAIYVTTPTAKFAKLIRIMNDILPPESRLPVITLHGLRHSAASLMVASGMDILTVSRRLGHARISHTLDIYSHADPSRDVEAAAIIESILSDED